MARRAGRLLALACCRLRHARPPAPPPRVIPAHHVSGCHPSPRPAVVDHRRNAAHASPPSPSPSMEGSPEKIHPHLRSLPLP
ncbi:hypothetical protein BS78_04G048900 [Paspalum vaginatum]|nr:hypothetical protein BS78_04G048900 [Paspalum vaginatum]